MTMSWNETTKIVREWLREKRPDLLHITEKQWNIQAKYLAQGLTLADAEKEVQALDHERGTCFR